MMGCQFQGQLDGSLEGTQLELVGGLHRVQEVQESLRNHFGAKFHACECEVVPGDDGIDVAACAKPEDGFAVSLFSQSAGDLAWPVGRDDGTSK
jgi:hypothetical protein